MSEGIHPFRGTVFGGFRRQDVLDYLAKSQAEHEETVTRLQQELDTAKEQAQSSKGRLEELEKVSVEAQGDGVALSQQLSEVRTTLESTQEELSAAQVEARELRTMVAQMEPKATAYTRLKERAASIELDAHERAQLTMEQAQAEIAILRQDCLRWMHGVQEDYSRLRGNLSSTFSQSARELERVCELFERMMDEFNVQEETLQDLLQKTEEVTGEE